MRGIPGARGATVDDAVPAATGPAGKRRPAFYVVAGKGGSGARRPSALAIRRRKALD